MARLPAPVEELVARFGPHAQRVPAGGWSTRGEPDRVVKTHCCFCGQQCGIQLKVKDEKVVGFEPWEEFPFNRGKLCPKGVKRYLQNAIPDRLLRAAGAGRGPGLPRRSAGTRRSDRTATEIQRIQAAHGPDAFAILTGASLTNEKAYLMGKFARRRRPHRATSTTTAGSAWSRRAPRRRRSSGSIAPPIPGATSPGPRSSWSPARTSPSARPSPPTTSGGRASAAPSSSSSTRG